MSEPPIGYDRQDFDDRAGNVIKYPNLIHSEPVLRVTQPRQSLDSTATGLLGFVPEMLIERIPHRGSHVSREPLEVLDGFRSEDDGEGHSGQIIARITHRSKKREHRTR
jgi:hypothetical protein